MDRVHHHSETLNIPVGNGSVLEMFQNLSTRKHYSAEFIKKSLRIKKWCVNAKSQKNASTVLRRIHYTYIAENEKI